MLGCMNPEALEKTLETKKVTFWSRTKGRLWTKGETSGNWLHLVDIGTDCDSDALLVLVNPDGPTCHRGTPSCFSPVEHKWNFLRDQSRQPTLENCIRITVGTKDENERLLTELEEILKEAA